MQSRRLSSTAVLSKTSLFKSYLIDPQTLHTAIEAHTNTQASRIVPLCASWFLPNDALMRVGKAVFLESRIPGAKFLDIDEIKDHESTLPHMLPTRDTLERALSELGVRNEDTLVVYDSKELGIFSAPRAAWMLKVFGHENVHILNNFKVWVEQGLPLDHGEEAAVQKSQYKATGDPSSQVVSFADVEGLARGAPPASVAGAIVVDARPMARWTGEAPEPRPGLSSGHIPGSISVPFGDLLDPTDKTILPVPELRQALEARGVDLSKEIISSCGTGVTAAIIETALSQVLGDTDVPKRRVYDGSWTEYAQRASSDLICRGKP